MLSNLNLAPNNPQMYFEHRIVLLILILALGDVIVSLIEMAAVIGSVSSIGDRCNTLLYNHPLYLLPVDCTAPHASAIWNSASNRKSQVI